MEGAKEKRKEWDREYPNIEGVFTSTGVIEPIQIDINDADVDVVLKQAVEKIESMLNFSNLNVNSYLTFSLDLENSTKY